MKSIVAAALGLVVLATPALAQRTFVGVTGGATLSDFGSTDSGSRWGGTAGITAGWRGLSWSVTNLEVAWTQRGDENVRLDYIDVPLLVGAAAATGNDFRARFYSGIDVAFKIGCNASSVIYCDNAKGTQWFLPLGVMIGRWKQGSTYFGIDVRYLVGLSDAFNIFMPVASRGWQFKVNIGKSVGQ